MTTTPPLDPLLLDMMYNHPERFTHLRQDEYMQMLIDDIRYYVGQLSVAWESGYEDGCRDGFENKGRTMNPYRVTAGH